MDVMEAGHRQQCTWIFWDWVVLFNFGNSNNDTSGVAAGIGIRIAPPERLAYFYHPMGWPSVDSIIPNFHM